MLVVKIKATKKTENIFHLLNYLKGAMFILTCEIPLVAMQNMTVGSQ